MKTHTYRQNGCNRGGTGHLSLLADKLPPRSQEHISFELVDPIQGRAATLAPELTARGYSVRVSERSAPLLQPASVDVYAVDDTTVPLRVLENRGGTSVVEVGLLVSVPTIEAVGGIVTAVAGTVGPGASPVRDGLSTLLRTVGALSPGRQSSERMSALGVHAEQMPRARRVAHDRLTSQSAAFLRSGRVDPEVVMIDGFTAEPYHMTVMEARRADRRRGLKQTALHEILQPTESGERKGVVFHDPQDPWLYVIFACREISRWRLDRAFELPVLRLQPEGEPVEAPTFVTD